jgi:hypothetical protein
MGRRYQPRASIRAGPLSMEPTPHRTSEQRCNVLICGKRRRWRLLAATLPTGQGRGERPRRVGPGRRRGRGTAGSALAAAALLRGDLRCDDAPWNGDAAIEHTESWRGADDDTEPASANVPGAGGYVNARELVAAQLPERLWSGYTGERGDAGSHRGKPPRCDRLLCGGERVHDPESRRCGVSAINEFEAKALELPGEAERSRHAGSRPGRGTQVCD